MKKIFFIFVSLLYLLILPINSFAISSYTWSVLEPTVDVSSDLNANNIDDTSNSLNLDCGSCILIEQHTGQVLYSYNSHEKLRPASVTKLMSIYLIMDAIKNRKNKL